MEITGITWLGPAIEDHELVEALPPDLLDVLAAANGFILYGGALHMRGAVHEPEWHSLRVPWRGPAALSALYPLVDEGDIPFAQDCVGDQFLLRNASVIRLLAETGEVETMGIGLMEYLERACADPSGFLRAAPLERHWADGGELAPGMLLHVYPPLCIAPEPDGQGYSLRPVPAQELIGFQADFARQIASVPNGTRIRINIRGR